jgi:type II secretory pathway component PulL
MTKRTTRRSKSVSWGDRALIILLVVVVISSMLFAATTIVASTSQSYAPSDTEMVDYGGFCGGSSFSGGNNCLDVSWNS